MTGATATRWLTALLIALLLSSSWLLDGPSDLEAAQAVADDKADAIARAQHVAPFGDAP